MELIIINQSKLKIMLSPPDMQRYELTSEHLDCTDEQTRRAFRRIFEDARTQSGFDTTGERLLVQLYTSKYGGCEIFVTKLGEKDAHPEDAQSLSRAEKALLQRVFAIEDSPASPTSKQAEPDTSVSMPCLPSTRPVTLLFSDMPSLLSACLRLHQLPYTGPSSAYALEEADGAKSGYCLLLHLPDNIYFHLPQTYGFLSEYGQETDACHMTCYLSEHGRPICMEKAVEQLSRLA